MAEIIHKRGGRFEIQVRHNFGRPNETLLDYLNGYDNKLRTTVIRKMVGAAGTMLAKEIRKQLKLTNMPYSRARNAAERKKARANKTKPLVRTISKRVWSKAHKGIIGVVVGPSKKEGRHGYLVEFGHKITGHKGRNIRNSGKMSVKHPFQQTAMRNIERDIFLVMANAMSDALKKAEKPIQTGWHSYGSDR